MDWDREERVERIRLLMASASFRMRVVLLHHQPRMENVLTCTLHPVLALLPTLTSAILLIPYTVLLKYQNSEQKTCPAQEHFPFHSMHRFSRLSKWTSEFQHWATCVLLQLLYQEKDHVLNCSVKISFGRKKKFKTIYLIQKSYNFNAAVVIMVCWGWGCLCVRK